MDTEDDSLTDAAPESEALTLPVLVHSIAVRCGRHEAIPDEVLRALERRLQVRPAAARMWPKLVKLLWVNALREAAPKEIRKLQDVVLKHHSSSDFLRLVVEQAEIFEDKLTDGKRRLNALALARDLVHASLRQIDEAWLYSAIALQNRVLHRHFTSARTDLDCFREDSKAIRIVNATMKLRSDIANAFVQWLKLQGPTAGALPLVGVVSRFFTKAAGSDDARRQVWTNDLRSVVTETLADLVQKALVQELWELRALEPLLAEMDEGTWDHLLPALVGASKKHPVATAAVLTHLAEHIAPPLLRTIDASSLASEQALGPLLRNLKSSTEESRQSACSTLKAVLTLNPLIVRVEVGQTLCDTLSGKEGSLAQWYQRCGVVLGLSDVLEAVSCPGPEETSTIDWEDAARTSLADRSALVLLELLAKEAHEETAAIAQQALTQAFALARDFTVIGPALEPLLQDTDLANAALVSLSRALPALRERKGLASLGRIAPQITEKLNFWMAEAQSRNSAQRNGVLAFHIAAALSLLEQGVLDQLSDSNWFVYAPGVKGSKGTASLWAAGGANRDVVVAACRGLGLALTSEGSSDSCLLSGEPTSEELRLLGLKGASPALGFLCLCATSVEARIRDAALEVLQELHARFSGDLVAPALLAAVFECVQEASLYFTGPEYSAEEALLEAEDIGATGSLPRATFKYYQRLLEACFPESPQAVEGSGGVASPDADIFSRHLPAILLLASHPVLSGAPLLQRRVAVRRKQHRGDFFKHLVQSHMLGVEDEGDNAVADDPKLSDPKLSGEVVRSTAKVLLKFSLSQDAVVRSAASASVTSLAFALGSEDTHSQLSRVLYSIGAKVVFETLTPLIVDELWKSDVFGLSEKEILAYFDPSQIGEEEAAAATAAALAAEGKTAPKTTKRSSSGAKNPPKPGTKPSAKAKAKAAGKKGRKGKGLGPKRKGKGTGLESLGAKATPKSTPKLKAAAKKPRSTEPSLTYGQKVQRRVGTVKAEAELLLACLDTILYASPEEGHKLIPELLPLLLGLVKISILEDAALESLCALTSTCDVCSLLPHLVLPMASSLRLVATTTGRLPDGFLVQRTVQHIANLCLSDDLSGDLDFSFSPQTYALVQPLLLAVVGQETSSAATGAEDVKHQLLAKHVVPLLHAHSAVHSAISAEEVSAPRSGPSARAKGVLMQIRSQNILLAVRCIGRFCELRMLDAASGREDPRGALLKISDQEEHVLSRRELGVLLGSEGLFSRHVGVRIACSRVRPELWHVPREAGGSDPAFFDLRVRLWVSCHDVDATVRGESRQAWENLLEAATDVASRVDLGFEIPAIQLLHDVPEAHVREAVAASLAMGLKVLVPDAPEAVGSILSATVSLFKDNPPPKARDGSREVTMEELFGSPNVSREEASRDKGKPFREAAASILGAFGKYRAFSALAESDGTAKYADARAVDVDVDEGRVHLEEVINFIIQDGLKEQDPDVRWLMLRAGARIAKGYGRTHCLIILEIVEERLESLLQTSGSAAEEAVADYQREGCVILLGTAATFLDASSEEESQKLTAIIDLLGATLATPSEAVQSSTGDVLVPLVKNVPATAHQLLDTLIATCLFVDEADRKAKKEKSGAAGSGARMSYGQRRGAAVGLAAIVKGLGIGCLAEHSIVEQLESAANSGMGAKEGTLLAIASLSSYLEILFEPYLHELLPILLRLFSDASDRVREAAGAAARNVMMHLSSYGVKVLLPSALKALGEPAWRVKQAAIGVLGAMSNCSPKQLSRFLPDIIPPLASTVSDAHQRVRDAGSRALKDMGDVMKNPEIRDISDMLFKALGNPTKFTGPALVSLLAVEFKHAVDDASLAFCIPLLVRGLKSRGHEQKRHAASITGNLVQVLARPESMLPYLDLLVGGLKPVLHDAMPDVRAVAARSMGAMIRGLGEEPLSDLIHWLLETSKSGESNAMRSGSAQGLSEALLVLGSSRCNGVLDEMIADSRNPSEKVREGVLWLLCFLPPGLGSEFSSRIGEALPVILQGLTDESDSVRDVARKAGQVLVGSHGTKFASLLLPPLQTGMLDDNWRMREASVQLLGDLLCKIGGTRAVGGAEAAADEGEKASGVNTGADAANAAILDVLGRAQRNSVLALLYMLRNDIETSVRQLAILVWKTVVPNLGRALREITGELIQHIVGSLSSVSFDRRLIAGRALGELVRKLGDTVLPDILPFLRAGLDSDDDGKRQGVCMGLSQVFEHASADQLEEYIPILVPAVCKALCDRSPKVRDAAGASFQTLYQCVGASALDAVIPDLVSALTDDGGDEENPAIFGLQSVIRMQPTELLQHLIPQWTKRPTSATKLRAIAAACRAAGSHIHFHFRDIVPCIRAGIVSENPEVVAAAHLAGQALCASTEDVGLNWLATQICEALDDEDPKARTSSAILVRLFFENSPRDYAEQLPIFVRHLVPLLVDTDRATLESGHAALVGMVKATAEEALALHVEFFRTTLASEVSNAKLRKGGVGIDSGYLLPATNEIPRGMAPFLPMFVTALKSGTSTAREAAALGLAEIVSMTEEKALKPFVAKLLGPLIRIGGNRLPAEVKGAIIKAQCGVLDRGGPGVKTFVPQLQTTFTKAVLDETSTNVRRIGTEALVKLMAISTRVPQVLQELGSAAGDSETLPPVRSSALKAIRGILRVAGDKVSPAHLNSLSDPVLGSLLSGEELVRQKGAKAMAALAVHLEPEVLAGIMASSLVSREPGREGLALGFAEILNEDYDKAVDALELAGFSPALPEVLRIIANDLSASQQTLRIAGCLSWGAVAVVGAQMTRPDILNELFDSTEALNSLTAILKDKADPDLRVVALKVVKETAKVLIGPSRRRLAYFVGAVYEAARGTQTRTRGPAERAMVHLTGSGSPVVLDLGAIAARERWMDPDAAEQLAEHTRKIYSRMPAESDTEED